MHSTRHKQLQSGFTLLEVMITLVIVSIITAIAYPSYVNNVTRARRAEVRGLLSENAQFMERFFTENNSYTLDLAGVAPALPVTTSPRTAVGTSVMYNISIVPPTALTPANPNTFTLQAVPVNTMAADPCVTYTVNSLGQKNNVGTLTGGMTIDTCWSK
ncbi:type IV pilin protein [soil metagenome]